MHIRWRGLELPSQVTCDTDSLTSTYGKFVVEPFERGFGVTVGNSLRRVLLSSLEGSAVTQLRVQGAQHEFTTIPGVVEDMTDVAAAADQTRSSLGAGGMPTKLEAAGMVVAAGEMAAIANGRTPNILTDLVAGEPVGTLFVPTAEKMNARSRWIGLTRRPRGKVRIDAGAADAVRSRKSLLASGITGVEGDFARGDVVAIVGPDGVTIAQGLANYGAEDVEKIKGLRTSRFAAVLGDYQYDEVVHADNLVLTG